MSFLLARAAIVAASAAAIAPAQGTPIEAVIDARVEARASAAGAPLAPLADDAEFLRRVTLDLTGVVPRVDAVRAFLADAAPDKRTRAIDGLLASDGFPRWYARWLLETLTARRATLDDAHNGYELMEWLRAQLAAGRPYDALMRDLITASGQSNVNGATNWLLRYSVRPADVTGALAKAMLGSSLRCAQCHDHKFRPVTQQQFWGVAAFFARTRPYFLENDDFGVADTRFGRLSMPAGGDPDAASDEPPTPAPAVEPGAAPAMAPAALAVAPRWLDGTRARSEEGLRAQLADFVVHDPDFARNLVNRLWAKLLGRGLIVPLDDMAGTVADRAAPTELVDELARFAVERRYDLRALVRAIVMTKTYQRSSHVAAPADDERLFTHARLRPFTVDQLYQSIVLATGYGQDEDDSDEVAAAEVAAEQPESAADGAEGAVDGAPMKPAVAAANQDGAMVELDDAEQARLEETYYADDEIPELCGGEPGTLRHALTRLDSEQIEGACDSAARLAMKLFGPPVGPQHVEWLWLSLLSRPPTAEEKARAEEWIASNGGRRKALHDLVWVLLNSQEFGTNH